MLRLAEVYLRPRLERREMTSPVVSGNSTSSANVLDEAVAETPAELEKALREETRTTAKVSCTPEEARLLRELLRSLRWYPHLSSFYRTPIRDFEKALDKLQLRPERREELFREFEIREVGMWIEIPVAQWERLKRLASPPGAEFRALPERSEGNEGENQRFSTETPLLTRENLRRCLRAIAQLQEEFGDASTGEIAEALELSREATLALLEALKREGKAYEAKPGKWRAVL
jgi:biotin operon repressor